MTGTPNLKIPYIAASQAQKHVTHNEALRVLDAVVQLSVVDRDLSAPPATPVDGDRYIVGPSATGAWAAHDGEVAAWQDNSWIFHVPKEGWISWIDDENVALGFDGATWTGIATGTSINPTALVGVNATADVTNRLSVASPSTLFDHDGNGHQIKINKNVVADTASILYQTGLSARAEIGLTGDDDFQFKVSPDGTQFTTGIKIDGNSGYVTAPANPSFLAKSTAAPTVGVPYKYNDIDHNIGNNYDATTGRFTAPVTGIYQVSVNSLSKLNSIVDTRLYKNGIALLFAYNNRSSVGYAQANISANLMLNTGDYLEVYPMGNPSFGVD